MSNTVPLGTLIEKAHLKYGDFESSEPLEAFGVSNTDGITQTAHRKSDDLSSYLVIEPGSFAYNPYRINVGSIGLTPEGLTGVVSPAYIVFKAKPGKLVPEVLLEFLKSKEGLRQINKLARGAVRKALRYDDLCEIQFPSIGYDQQLAILKSKIEFNKVHERLLSEITHQESLLGKLKQAILQEAIQGKLTADWRAETPDIEPASELLQRIQAEKARLIAEKKIRKEKPLPEITPEEIPFEIPDGWEWCRFGEVIRLMNGASFASGDFHKGDGVKCIKITNTGVGQFVETDDTLPSNFSESYSNYQVFTGDMILALTRPYIADGLKISRCPESYNGALLNQRVAAIRSIDGGINPDFAFLFLGSDFVLRDYQAEFESKGQQPNLKSSHVTHLRFPLPPLAEQAAIVERVEALIATCRELETEIERSRTHAADLLQAVLKEAFAPAS
jgi:type I restriction enzyme S subunit